MSAEEELIDSLMRPPYIGDSRYGCDEDEARMLVRAFAHELAEKQRERLLPDDEDPHVSYNRTVRRLADLIDPKKEGQ